MEGHGKRCPFLDGREQRLGLIPAPLLSAAGDLPAYGSVKSARSYATSLVLDRRDCCRPPLHTRRLVGVAYGVADTAGALERCNGLPRQRGRPPSPTRGPDPSPVRDDHLPPQGVSFHIARRSSSVRFIVAVYSFGARNRIGA